ncbi:MAG: response regulator [Bacteroidota bacterium]
MNKKIIIVEDDPFTQEFYKYLFSKTSYQTVTMEDGDKLIENLGQEEVNLIIMDINLKNTYMDGKKVDGVILSRFIKQNEKFGNIPILLVTAYQKGIGNNNFLEESMADDYIVKPIIDYNDLLNKVNSLVMN